jgi:hypothetical protein
MQIVDFVTGEEIELFFVQEKQTTPMGGQPIQEFH